jgi:hypothetical protein
MHAQKQYDVNTHMPRLNTVRNEAPLSSGGQSQEPERETERLATCGACKYPSMEPSEWRITSDDEQAPGQLRWQRYPVRRFVLTWTHCLTHYWTGPLPRATYSTCTEYACAGWRLHVRAFARVRLWESCCQREVSFQVLQQVTDVAFHCARAWIMASNYRHGTKQPSQTCGVHWTSLRTEYLPMDWRVENHQKVVHGTRRSGRFVQYQAVRRRRCLETAYPIVSLIPVP